ncbi:unnamed protein product [Linum tenue]|uniref:Xaa-Pro dipeptidase n=1 Tax=Linum tenue TaxID=586396 RepID=A0AAV0QHX7_9ROSI|nr:unnamed protein product [Linum tenue]
MAASALSPPEVPMELHVSNREKLLQSIRHHLAENSLPLQGFVLLQGGDEQTRYCTDHLELFRQESYFAYLFGVVEPGFYGAIDIATGKSILFAPRLPAEYAVWMGKIKSLSYYQERYLVTEAYYTDEIVEVLLDQSKGIEKPLLFLLHGLNTDSNNYSKPADFKGMETFQTDVNMLHPILTECRVIKSDLELAVIQFANDISSEAHVQVMRNIKPGMKEYQLESTFQHHTYMYGGCRHCSYTCICATGENSAVLHYGHAAAPNDRTLQDGDMALFDMGAEYQFYGSDITCSFPVNGKFTSDQSLIYNVSVIQLGSPFNALFIQIKTPTFVDSPVNWNVLVFISIVVYCQCIQAVLDAHDSVISAMKPGVSWIDMHKLAETVVLDSLRKGGIIVGDVADMMAERFGAVFMPHGLGHFLGIDTHDPGGYLKVHFTAFPSYFSCFLGRVSSSSFSLCIYKFVECILNCSEGK